MVNDSEYFKKRYKLFIRFIKENNLYGEYRRIRENLSVLQKTMLGRRIRTKGQALHMMMVATDVGTAHQEYKYTVTLKCSTYIQKKMYAKKYKNLDRNGKK